MNKLLIIISSVFVGVAIATAAVAFQRGILMNTASDGSYYQDTCPLGPAGTFMMSDPAAPCGVSWQPINFFSLPDTPFSLVSTTAAGPTASTTGHAASMVVSLKATYTLSSSTASSVSAMQAHP